MSGTWIMELVSLSDTPVPIVEKVTARTFSLTLVDVEQNGSDLTFRETVCRLDTQLEISVVQMTPSKNFTKALSGKVRTARLVRKSPSEIELLIDDRTIVHSAKLQDRENEPLPTNPDDPRVFDGDHDGHPGMTMKFSGLVIGEAYVVQRTKSEMRGKLLGPDLVKGPMFWQTEQVVLDVSNPFLRFAPKPKAGVGRDDSFFVLRRAQNKPTCDDVSYSKQVQLMVKNPEQKAN